MSPHSVSEGGERVLGWLTDSSVSWLEVASVHCSLELVTWPCLLAGEASRMGKRIFSVS